MTPLPSSAEDRPRERADDAFLVRRRHQLREPSHRRIIAIVVAALVVLSAVGATVGVRPTYGSIDRLAAKWAKSGAAENQRGGSICVGWPATLTISTRPTDIPPDQALVFLSMSGWHLYLGANLADQEARIEITSVDGELQIEDGADDAERTASGDVVLKTTPSRTGDAPTASTVCRVRSMTITIVAADGTPLPANTIVLANGTSPGTNPYTFERATA